MEPLTRIERFEVQDPTHGALPALAVLPALAGALEPALLEPLPVCLFLYGGGGSHETLLALEPLLGAAWQSGELPALLVACLNVPPFCFYLDDPSRGLRWQSAVAEGLLERVRVLFPERATPARAGLVGISMGGYGALKMAFHEPRRFQAVAAVAPMIEPSTEAASVPLRNRFHYPELVPPQLVGPARDPELFRVDHPVTRARRNAREIRDTGLAIYLDAGSRDVLHAHDGAEFLHRALWELDLAHEYHLLREANHVGPTLPSRLLRAFAWVADQLRGTPAPWSDDERALDEYLAPRRRAASERDPSFARTYGRLSE